MATEVRNTEKKGILETKNKEFPKTRKLLITLLIHRPVRYYFHLMGRIPKYQDLNYSIKFIWLPIGVAQ